MAWSQPINIQCFHHCNVGTQAKCPPLRGLTTIGTVLLDHPPRNTVDDVSSSKVHLQSVLLLLNCWLRTRSTFAAVTTTSTGFASLYATRPTTWLTIIARSLSASITESLASDNISLYRGHYYWHRACFSRRNTAHNVAYAHRSEPIYNQCFYH